jgi:post-segregation antitoxin (ccd killing protein)
MVIKMGKKVRTTLTIDEEVLKTAMQIGINVSQFCENALREGIERLKSPINAPEGKSAPVSLSSVSLLDKRKSAMEPRAGFGPATITLPR